MSVLVLDKYRKTLRKKYFAKYSSHYDRVITSFLEKSGAFSLEHLVDLYQKYCEQSHASTWDQDEFRALLFDVVQNSLSLPILEKMSHEYWFDPRFVSEDAITERCIEIILLGEEAVTASKRL